MWTRSQNPFRPETGLQAFRQLKALTWTRGSASQLVTKLQSGTQSPTAPTCHPHKSFVASFSHALLATCGGGAPTMMGVRPPSPSTGANMEISLRLNGQTTRRPKHSPPSSAGVGGLGLAGGMCCGATCDCCNAVCG